MEMSNTSGVVQHRQVFSPWTDGLGVLASHYTGDLRDVAEVVRYPGGKQLPEGYRTELGVAPTPVQVVTRDSQRLQAAEARRSSFGKGIEQLSQGLAT